MMANFIINPWIFYLIQVIINLNIFLLVSTIILATISILTIVGLSCKEDVPPVCITLTKITPIFIILFLLVPTESTMNKMLISYYVTTENISETKETAKELIDYIVDKAKELQEGTQE